MNKHVKIYLFLTDNELLTVKGGCIHIKWINFYYHETWLMHLTRIIVYLLLTWSRIHTVPYPICYTFERKLMLI